MSLLERRLAELETMSPAQLRAAWRESWRRPAPDFAPDLLRRGIAWKLQSRVHGVLPSDTKRSLEAAAERLRKGEPITSVRSITLKPGTRLVRSWRGKTHQVIVLESGYEHEQRRYTSLTQIAFAITGTRWSGPAFFGLKKRSGRVLMKRRCAIYTRKSTEEGLEQAFNSLDAQREACAAYILSQTHEGWELINEQYDDGGWSGGNMARPGLRQLLADVAAGKVDVIVVYKVDRLTRSLADFARIVDTLDGAGASFVSVTQAFNTTSSMGRLTLNVLLSFAQFEREVTSERIRDKVAASKRKGMWMGGPVPIGYRLAERKLIIADEEAEVVRSIFERYVVHRSMCLLADELAARGVRTKQRSYANGRTVGGIPFTTGPLAALLKNPVYLGKVAHAGSLYEGEHEAIVSQELWDRVQNTLATNRRERREGRNAKHPSLLTGMITDPEGRMMSPVFSSRAGQRHHYYVTRLQPGEDRTSAWRLPARDIDRAVITSFAAWLAELDPEMDQETRSETQASILLMSVPEQRTLLLKHEATLSISGDQLVMTFTAGGSATEIRMAATLARKGVELKLVVGQTLDDTHREPDPVLLKLITLAHTAQRAKLMGSEDALLSRYSKAHLQQLLRISWLAPDIVAAIADGRQPATLTGRRLLRSTNIPLSWEAQRKLFSFA